MRRQEVYELQNASKVVDSKPGSRWRTPSGVQTDGVRRRNRLLLRAILVRLHRDLVYFSAPRGHQNASKSDVFGTFREQF